MKEWAVWMANKMEEQLLRMEQLRLSEFVAYEKNWKKRLLMQFVGGIARGLGTAAGCAGGVAAARTGAKESADYRGFPDPAAKPRGRQGQRQLKRRRRSAPARNFALPQKRPKLLYPPFPHCRVNGRDLIPPLPKSSSPERAIITMRKPVSQRLLPLLLILLTLALDRFTKALAVALPDERTLIPGILRWIYVENTGMAFSLFSGQSWMLGVVSVIAVIAGWLVLRRYQLSGWSRTAAALMIGGALGNAYDRLALGYVVDMLDITLFPFAVFNIADAALVVGTVLMAYCIVFRTEDWRKINHDANDA